MSEISIRVYQVAQGGQEKELQAARVVRNDRSAYAAVAHPSAMFPPCRCPSPTCPDRRQ
ncbi:hypothetical protein GXW82_44330 [Streptacidiphilus sp. 4-A2]|nr:hypothetical protein [Streptacidiphilus sp. 4-A2]